MPRCSVVTSASTTVSASSPVYNVCDNLVSTTEPGCNAVVPDIAAMSAHINFSSDMCPINQNELQALQGAVSIQESYNDSSAFPCDFDVDAAIVTHLGDYNSEQAYRVLDVLCQHDCDIAASTCCLGNSQCVSNSLCVSCSDVAHSVDVVVKLDTACSKNMSGVPGRLDPSTMYVRDVMIKGFNNSVSSAAAIGQNEDHKEEYFVASMPRNLALLCAHEYTKEGATVLFPDGGAVIKLDKEQQDDLRKFIRPFPMVKRLVVRNRTYEIAPTTVDYAAAVSVVEAAVPSEEAHSSTATRYFNSKVNVSNTSERVLATMLTGLQFQDLYDMAKNESVDGLPRDLTVSALNHFEHKYGRNPDALQMALPNLAGNTKGYMAPSPRLSSCGERVEADYFESEFNDPHLTAISTESLLTARKKVGKLQSHGGAVAAFVAVDAYSGFVHGRLVHDLRDSVEHVKFVHSEYLSMGHKIRLFAADQGILSQSLFRVSVPAVQKYLQKKLILSECGEAHNHNHGTTHIERVIRSIKELQRFAMLYILNNPNFKSFGFTKLQILKLWGDIFYWAITIINLKPCIAVPGKTKYEVFCKQKPDLRIIRLLPIFASIQVLRRTPQEELNSTGGHWQRGLYVGPSMSVRGAVRVALITRGHLVILTTTAFKAVSDGGNVNPYDHVDHALPSIINEYATTVPTVDTVSAPVTDVLNLVPLSDAECDQPVPSTTVSVSCDVSNESVPALPSAPSALDGTADVSADERPSTVRGSERAVVEAPDDDNSTNGGVPVNNKKNKNNNKRNRSKSKKNTTESLPVPIRAAPAVYDPKRITRAERMQSRQQRVIPEHVNSAEELLIECFHANEVEECNFVDWSKHEEGTYYWSYASGTFVTIRDHDPLTDLPIVDEECYRAVTKNVPKNFTAALQDPEWAVPARTELHTVTSGTNCIVNVDQDIARENIKNGAEVLRLLSVYEEKIKDGVLVRKVRLVADGRHHNKHGPTYAATPSREELLMLFHIFASDDMDYYFLDEVRAFLSAARQDDIVTYAKLSGDSKFYQILNALYGMKTASRDHQLGVRDKLEKLGFKRLMMSSSIYKYQVDGVLILVFVYVDDFIFGATCNKTCLQKIAEFRLVANTSEPELNARAMLGLEVERNKDKRIIMVSMKKKIAELCELYSSDVMRRVEDVYPNGPLKTRKVPMPTVSYIVKDYEFEKMPEHKQRMLDRSEIEVYMSIVGSLTWIQGCLLYTSPSPRDS